MTENEKAVDAAAESEPRGTTVVEAAAYLMTEHENTYGEPLDETKLHCLLYFAQRTSYALYDKPLFPEALCAGPDGPFSPEAHEFFQWAQEQRAQTEEHET